MSIRQSWLTIGFDLRVDRAPDDPWFSEYLIRKDLSTPVSVDSFVFPEARNKAASMSGDDYESRVNVLGLLKSAPKANLGEWAIAIAAEETVVRAFTFRVGKPLVSSAFCNASDVEANGFTWLGYDVADFGKLVSGLMNCGPHKSAVVKTFSRDINKYGLFEDLKVAKEFARIRAVEIKAHSPFCPFGIWTNHL